MSFAVRTLHPPAGLDGAFRIHVLPEHLDQAGLRLGDLCEITDENGSAVGYGVAWRATDKMGTNPKVRPVKMSETLQAAYGIRASSQVMLYHTEAKVVPADEVVLTDVTPSQHLENAQQEDAANAAWRWRCGHALANCDAFASGATFDVNAKKGLRKRFYVDRIKSSKAQPGPPNLYSVNDNTVISFNDPGSSTSPDIMNTMYEDPLSEKYIGGLCSQIEELNMRLKRSLKDARESKEISAAYKTNESILVHGFEGTGKSLLLKRLQQRKPFRGFLLKKSALNSASAAKNMETIKEMFKDARTKQPSLILIDDINEIAPSDDRTYVDAIIQELEHPLGSQVLVIAACRSPSDVNSKLLADNFQAEIELPVPDQLAREQILDILIHTNGDAGDELARSMGARTHGFTGRDLSRLVKFAAFNTYARCQRDHKSTNKDVHGSLEHSLDGATIAGAIDKQNGSSMKDMQNGEQTKDIFVDAASEAVEDDYTSPTLTIADFMSALSKVRPTALREIIFEPPKTTWADIGGSQDIQTSLDKIILYPQEHFVDMRSYNKRAKKGVLLYGPPGCSKTLTAQAIATKYGLNFITVKGSELISMYVGESERAVRELFRKARAAKPCVIFFDEIDSIASARETGASKGLNVLTTLLNEMDGFDVLQGVLVLAATNKPAALDAAIMRPGRFDAHFYLGLPDTAARSEIFQICAKGAPGAEALDYSQLASMTDGYTGAEISKIYDLATDIALERKIKGQGGEPGNAHGTLQMADFDIGIQKTEKGVGPDMLAGYDAFKNSQKSA